MNKVNIRFESRRAPAVTGDGPHVWYHHNVPKEIAERFASHCEYILGFVAIVEWPKAPATPAPSYAFWLGAAA